MRAQVRVLAGMFVSAGLLALVPVLVQGGFWITLGLQVLLWITLATSWNIFSGYAGYPSFGHGVFFGIGIYTTSTLVRYTDLAFPLVLISAGVVASAVAAVVGAAMFASRRFRGDLFALVTLVLAFVVPTVIANLPSIDGGSGAFIRAAQADWVVATTPRIYSVTLTIATITVVLAYLISTGRWGSALKAIHDDEDVAETLGVPTYRYKVGTFALSAGLAGMVGAPHAVFLGYVEVDSIFALSVPLFVILMAILGGTTTWFGPIVGAVVFTAIRQGLIGQAQPEVTQIVIAALLILMVLLRPQGIGGILQRRLPGRVPRIKLLARRAVAGGGSR